jgi:hypothetical protein
MGAAMAALIGILAGSAVAHAADASPRAVSFVARATAPLRSGVSVTGPTSAAPGDLVCFTVTSAGGIPVTVSVEGEPGSGSGAYVLKIGPGTWVVCFIVPDVPSGTTMTVSATTGGRSGSASMTVS